MKIGIIGMTTTGLAAGAALANAGFETLLYCPDDEEAAEFIWKDEPTQPVEDLDKFQK